MKQIKKHELFPLIRDYLPENPVIVEAGAFDGRDTIKMAAAWPASTIHAFEPVPAIFALLQGTTAEYSQIHRHPYALADTTGTAPLYVSEKPSRPGQPFQAGSLLEPHERLKLSDVQYPHTITVDTITLDDWAQRYGVTHVDFIWLDVQGFALNILRAAPHILKTVRVLYIEVEFVEAYKNQYQYHDVAAWVQEQGFVIIARDFSDEPTWFYGNIVCVANDLVVK